MKELLVGDPHATVEDLEDCTRLMDYVTEVAVAESVDRVTILGDLHHNHSLVSVQVMDFWKSSLEKLRREATSLHKTHGIVLLVGNHDMMGDGSRYPHALIPYEELAYVVDSPQVLNSTLYVPFYSNPNLFIIDTNKYTDIPLLVCHQEFNGAYYENGFYAPGGVNADSVSQKQIISGHIHAPQRFGKVWYPGAPRWRTISDADVERRSVAVINTVDGVITDIKEYDTTDKVRKIVALEVTEANVGEVLSKEWSSLDSYRVTVKGTSKWIHKTLKQVKDKYPLWSLKAVRTDDKVIKVRESDGVNVAFSKFVDAFVPPNGSDKGELEKLAKTRYV